MPAIAIQNAPSNARNAVASLGWVTPGAATEGVTPLFFSEKNWRPFLVASSVVSPLFIFSSQKLTTFFVHHCHYHYHFLLLSLGCHHLLLPVRSRFSIFFVNLPTIFFLSGVTRGGPPPLVTPLTKRQKESFL